MAIWRARCSSAWSVAVGAWWLDPAVGSLSAGAAVKEGHEAGRGAGCCMSSPLDGVGFAHDDCCKRHLSLR
jgi:hypothetical protein